MPSLAGPRPGARAETTGSLSGLRLAGPLRRNRRAVSPGPAGIMMGPGLGGYLPLALTVWPGQWQCDSEAAAPLRLWLG